MLTDCNYDKTKIIHDLSRIAHFIKNHAVSDAKKEGHPLCAEMYKEIAQDIESSLAKLRAAITGLAKENKY